MTEARPQKNGSLKYLPAAVEFRKDRGRREQHKTKSKRRILRQLDESKE